MIHYNIDTTDNGYCNFEGDVQSLTELKQILFKNNVVPDLVGSLSMDNLPNVSIWISAENGLGFFISITNAENTFLTLGDSHTLSETVDVWGDGLFISKGLFIPFSLAWKGLEEYVTSGQLSKEINWITPEGIPEDGNYI